MNCPFNKKHSRRFSRILCLVLAALMVAAMFAGCKKEEKVVTPETEQPLTPPNLIESTAPTEAPKPTEAPTEPEKKDVAIVKEQVNVRSSPSVESNVIGTLDAGDEVTVNRVETVSGIQWAYIPLKGWVTVDNLDMTNVAGSVSSPAGTPANPQATEAPPTVATEPPANNNNNTNTNAANTGTGEKGVVTANGLNVRAQANTTSDIVGNLPYGTRVTIQEKNDGWGRTGMGWISLGYVYLDGTRGTNTCTGTITGSQLNVRSGPGTNYESVSAYNKGDTVDILEQIKVGTTTWGCTNRGWISMDYVNKEGTGSSSDEEVEIDGIVTGDRVNVRSGPGTNYDVVDIKYVGDEVTITRQTTVGDVKWGKIAEGWISMAFVGAG